ncbi:MAG: serine hydroxymethyltransferase [Candidatus Colwellbacteria bacterium RIFCSPLOWO2_02_FULL_44_20b]|uniref:Serine hydroxymethyltransferase n=1 Tax=Candidatus Colwellbacteria bacterium RIFCSPLOWO2_02_FULL_44_20b TaxID=1797691 RepID=A0A1G1Z614_9BACT|nr:MAG: serine hydroxymethyltransferase [Candidatus Colwellbacteria bacterium RIFCSPLOWO2_02_FULL_44_20b]
MHDKVLEQLLKKETRRQEETLDLIASENIASPEILRLLGSPLTNKYSEGYAGKRYYPGNQYYDQIELLAIERGLKAFRLSPTAWHLNVQALSGSPANLEAYFGLMEFGDTFMGMALAPGGHLTHGHKVNFSGKAYNAVQYGTDPKTGLLDYEEIAKLARKHKPKVIVSGITAYPRAVDFKKFGAIAKSVGAYHMADIAHIAGLVVAGAYPSPFPYADVVTMTTHKTLRGPRGALIFCRKELATQIDKAVFPGMQGGPHNNVTAGVAQMFFEALQPSFKVYGKQIVKNAKRLAQGLKQRGFTLVTGGTDSHMILLDMRNFGIDGMEAQTRLEDVGIVANRNSVPGDLSPFKPSGVRLGTPSLTTRGMKEREMDELAELMYLTLHSEHRTKRSAEVKRRVKKLCVRFPAYRIGVRK